MAMYLVVVVMVFVVSVEGSRGTRVVDDEGRARACANRGMMDHGVVIWAGDEGGNWEVSKTPPPVPGPSARPQ